MKIEIAKIADLKPLEKNIRQHPEVQIKELMKSLQQFGQTRALVVDEAGSILVGNGLYEALKRLGNETCAVYRVVGLSEKEKKKLIVSDNKTYDLGLNNFEELQNYINDITLDGDFDIAGFDEGVLREMTRSLETVEKEMMSYGVQETPISPSPSPAATPSVMPETFVATPAATPAYTAPSAPSVAEHTERAQVETTRKIVCPNCGEVIYID